MGALNPNLLSQDVTVVISDAADITRRSVPRNLTPEAVLWALLNRPGTDAYRFMEHFAERRGTDLEHLAEQTQQEINAQTDKNGDLDFLLPDGGKFPLSRQMVMALDVALTLAQQDGERAIDTDHLLISFTDTRLTISKVLHQHGITETAINTLSEPTLIRKRESSSVIDYIKIAEDGQLPDVHYRHSLLLDIFGVISQSQRQHLILVGPDGVGKRTLAYSLALSIKAGTGPKGIERFIQVDERALLENDTDAIQSAIRAARGGIFFVPHLHRFFGNKAEFPRSAQPLQKALINDTPIIIGTTTQEEYESRLQKVTAIAEHTQILRVDEPDEAETLEILTIIGPSIAADYSIEISPEALRIAAALARRYMTGNPLPRSAVHLLHRAAAMVNINQQSQIVHRKKRASNMLDADDITLVASQILGVPVSKLASNERNRYADMDSHLHQRIIGQKEAVAAVSRAVKTARVGLKDPQRPIGSFLFLGPSGVGKTELARALAEFLFDDESAMLQLDMSEYMEENAITRLVGALPGYVGHMGGGQLTDRVREQPYIVVLFDEVEKAHERVVDVLLQVLEDGRLTDSQGRTVQFSESVVILTSNLGSRHINSTTIDDKTRERVMGEVKRYFRPEFLNRLDDIIVFHPLDRGHLLEILNLALLREIDLVASQGLDISFTENARDWLLDQLDNRDAVSYGARPLRRIIQRHVREPLADYLLENSYQRDEFIDIDADQDGLIFNTSSVQNN